jgi:hypothetical protein
MARLPRNCELFFPAQGSWQPTYPKTYIDNTKDETSALTPNISMKTGCAGVMMAEPEYTTTIVTRGLPISTRKHTRKRKQTDLEICESFLSGRPIQRILRVLVVIPAHSLIPII